jgi:2-phosphosulfolactate phosphatase
VNEPALTVDVGWGPNGLRDLAPRSDVVVIIDVLRFTTAVDVAVSRGADVFPYKWHDGTEATFAQSIGAELAVPQDEVDEGHPWSLSPVALGRIPAGTKLVLPSPNGAALAFAARDAGAQAVVAGCLRNATAVGRFVASIGGTVGILASGERWRGATGPLRPAVEDWVGAGAIVAALGSRGGPRSPDAIAAAGSFDACRAALEWTLASSTSGRFLTARGLAEDVALAAELDRSDGVPLLVGDCFVDGKASSRDMRE